MQNALMTAEGLNGVISLFSDRVRIRRKGVGSFFTHGLKGEKDIQLNSISSVQFKNAGRLTNGYIQIAFMGGSESKGGIYSAAYDENTVIFKRSQQSAFSAMREAVQERISKPESGNTGSADEIEKLANLRDRGIITDEEFQAKKQQILGL